MRFGLDDGVMHTLEETGEEFGVTRERIRQIQAKALEKLRSTKNSKKLETITRILLKQKAPYGAFCFNNDTML